MIKKILLVLLLVGVCISCAACRRIPNVNENEPVEPTLFSVIENYEDSKVIVDNETGVMYWLSYGGYNRGTLTLLVDETGKPRIFEGWRSGND